MKNLFRLSFMAIAVILFYAGCKKDDSSPSTSGSPGANEVWMQSSTFSPSSRTVSVNTIVTWTNKDGVTHTVTSNSSAFSSGNISAGGTYSHQFTAAGSFPYHCAIHSGMTGTIVVQ